MRHRVEQGRFQPFALLESLSLTGAFECFLEFLVQSLNLIAPGMGLFGAPFRTRVKLSDGDGGNEKGDQREPVVRTGYAQAAYRWEEKIVEAKNAEQRSYY